MWLQFSLILMELRNRIIHRFHHFDYLVWKQVLYKRISEYYKKFCTKVYSNYGWLILYKTYWWKKIYILYCILKWYTRCFSELTSTFISKAKADQHLYTHFNSLWKSNKWYAESMIHLPANHFLIWNWRG